MSVVEAVARLLHADIATAGFPHLNPSAQAARVDVDWEERPEADRANFRQRAAEIVAFVRAEVADEIAEAITANVRNEDWSKQDRGGFYGVAPKMAYVGGHDKAAEIARSLREAS